MTKEEAKEFLPLIQAYAEGKTIQVFDDIDSKWYDTINGKVLNCNFMLPVSKYRIKPEPKYRSFKNKEECWNEMLKHQPFGWVKVKNSKMSYTIVKVDNFYIITALHPQRSFIDSFSEYEFADGTPFGIKEE